MRGSVPRLDGITHSPIPRRKNWLKPKLLVLYHQLYFANPDDVDLVKEIKQGYSGAVVSGRDLGVY